MEAKVEDALAFLQKSSVPGGVSLFDHLADVLGRVLERRADNSLDTFEALSFEMRATRPGTPPTHPLPPRFDSEAELALAARRLELLRKDREEREDEDVPEPLLDDAPMWEAAGVGSLGSREELVYLALSIRELAAQRGIKQARVWGKLLGRTADYFVLETDPVPHDVVQPTAVSAHATTVVAEGDADEDDEEEMAKKKAEREAAERLAAEQEEARAMATDVPMEEDGLGSNKYAFWVCRRAGEAWTRLPSVTPAQIQASRRVRKLLTGRLDADVAVVLPPRFPGREMHLVRALIARISAATLVSPKGFYSAVDAEDDSGDDFDRPEQLEVVEQEEWTGLQAAAMLDPRNWVHHAPALLVQGRCSFWRAPKPATTATTGDEDETEVEQIETETETDDAMLEPAEVPPPLLSSVSDDAQIGGGMAAWGMRVVHGIPGKSGCVVVSSNRWPGAHTAAVGPKWSNIYIGNGLKYSSEPWTPPLPKMPVAEFAFPTAEATTEAADPTLEEENEEKAAVARAEAEAAAKIEQEKADAERHKKEEEEAASKPAEAGKAAATSADEFDDETLDEDEDEDETQTGATESETTTS